MTSADVVVIGGGVNGASVAFNLARLGVRRVVLLERRHLGAGASGKSGSLVRMHYTNEAESRLAWESLKVFRDFDAMVGGDCGFEAPGFVQIVDPAHADALRANVAMQQGLGIDTRLVSREELTEISPDLRVDDVGAAAYEPGSGFADPNATTFAFAAAARRLGATIETDCEALRIVTEGAAWPAWRRPEDGWPLPWWWPSPARGPAGFSIRSASTSGSRPTGSRYRYSAGRKASRAVTPR